MERSHGNRAQAATGDVDQGLDPSLPQPRFERGDEPGVELLGGLEVGLARSLLEGEAKAARRGVELLRRDRIGGTEALDRAREAHEELQPIVQGDGIDDGAGRGLLGQDLSEVDGARLDVGDTGVAEVVAQLSAAWDCSTTRSARASSRSASWGSSSRSALRSRVSR